MKFLLGIKMVPSETSSSTETVFPTSEVEFYGVWESMSYHFAMEFGCVPSFWRFSHDRLSYEKIYGQG